MKIILAQGNPTPAYAATRHNIGFMVVDELARQTASSWVDKPKFQALIAETTVGREKVLLVKPTTYYNETGRTAQTLLDFYKREAASDLLVLHDDLALPYGTIRTRHKGRDAGNNGIKSINAHVGEAYGRIRIGIWNELRDRMNDADFVLARLSREETELLPKIITESTRLIEAFTQGALADHSINLQPKPVLEPKEKAAESA